jgi:hypothetical protein
LECRCSGPWVSPDVTVNNGRLSCPCSFAARSHEWEPACRGKVVSLA